MDQSGSKFPIPGRYIIYGLTMMVQTQPDHLLIKNRGSGPVYVCNIGRRDLPDVYAYHGNIRTYLSRIRY